MKQLQRVAPHLPHPTVLSCPTRRRSPGSLLKRLALALALSGASAASLQAATVIDSFDDVSGATPGLSLVTLNTTGVGGVGFTTKYEQTGSSVIVLRTNDLTVGLANYVSGQAGYAQHWSVAATVDSSGLARRAQTRSTPTLSGTIWFSFLASLLSTNGDVGLVFNGGYKAGGSGSPASTVSTPGMRVGLGSNARAAFRGALGVGPATAGATSLELSNIVNGVNGAVTPAWFVPTNGTAVLILGRIDTDPLNSLPRVSLWYNPDVPNQASLPAPTLSFTDAFGTNVTTSITRVGYQIVRSSTLGTQNEAIDNIKVSDEPNAFDIVYKNAALPIPTVSVLGTVLQGSEAGPSNLVFTVTCDRPAATALTVNYTLGGVATNGYDGVGSFIDADYTDSNFNPATLSSSVIIPQGQSNATVVLQVIDDALAEGTESVIFTLQPSADFLTGGVTSLTGSIADNNDAGVSLQYMFTRTLAPQIWDTNMTAASASVPGLGNNYSGTYFISGDASFSAGGDATGADEATAVAQGDYMGLRIGPVQGRTLTLTNFEFQAMYGNYLNQVPGAAQAVVFVRSSLDNFTTNLTQFVILPDNIVFPNSWYSNYVALGSEFSNLPAQVEFRLYIYDDSSDHQVGVRIDNLYFNGTTAPLPPGVNQVIVSTNVINAAEPSTAGQFSIVRLGDLTSPLAVNYTVGGTALNGVDYVLLPGTATIPAGESNLVVAVTPINDEVAEAVETVVLSLAAGANYGVLSPSSVSLTLADDGDLGPGALATYFFNENDNAFASLSMVAAASIQLTNAVTASNAAAGPGLGLFGRNNIAGVGHGYANSQWYSAPSTLFIRGEFSSTNAEQALADGDYFSFSIGALPGSALTLTNFSVELKLQGNSGQTNWMFLRCSADNFGADLGSFTVPGTDLDSDPWLLWNVPLGLTNVTSALEFRLYAFATRTNVGDILRLDNASFFGNVQAAAVQPHITGINVLGASVEITFTAGASDVPAAFKLRRSAAVAASYAEDTSATVTSSGAGQFKATTTTNGGTQFYRISR